uniref:Uncharacterized protein n=1 Tax=Chenopodium quinoa TaxID=63459 RepID=A0A803L9V7_CHEQI
MGFVGSTGYNVDASKGGDVNYYIACVYGSPYVCNRLDVWNKLHELMNKFKGTENRDPIYEQLDRAYANDEWRFSFPDAFLWNLPLMFSDHGPIILQLKRRRDKKCTPYKMEAWSLKLDEVHDLISSAWTQKVQGSPMYSVQKKISRCLREVKHWCLCYKNSHENGNWQKIQDEFEEAQKYDKLVDLHSGLEIDKRKQLEEEATRKWLFWKQRAKSKWDMYGDQSTTFFFKSLKQRAARMEIRALKNN